MKALTAAIVAGLLALTSAYAQDGAHEHAPDPRVSDLETAVESQSESLSAISKKHGGDTATINAALESITARLDALEAGEPSEPSEPTEPEPSSPTVYYTMDGQALSPLPSETFRVAGPFNLCLLDEDTSGPVVFSWPGGGKTESQSAFCIFGGNEIPLPTSEWSAGEYAVEITGPDFDLITVRLVVENNAPEPPPTGDETASLQVGPWNPASYNIEEPFLNIILANQSRWLSANLTPHELIDQGYIGQPTGLPASLPNGEALTSEVYFTVPHKSGLGYLWDGDWVLDWQTADGQCNADISLLYFDSNLITSQSPCRIEFLRDAAGGRTPYHMALRFYRVDSPVTSLRMYRAENEAALNEGRIYNPRFVEAVGDYDIVRTMDLQLAGRAETPSVDDLSTMNAGHWGNKLWQSPAQIEYPFVGMPLEAVFALGVEADTTLWVHAPITLGSTVDIYDPAIYDANAATWLNNITAAVKADTDAILASEQWDRYADRFVAALIDSGYPETRTLYVTVANEVWNYAGQYNFTTRYAGALGSNMRDGYGKALARFKLALDAALRRAGREQNLVYVVESQAANPDMTRLSLVGMQNYLTAQGEDWARHAPALGISVASYWGAYEKHLTGDGVDPNDTEALEDWFLNGPDRSVSTLPWNLKKWRGHAQVGEKFGVAFIGAYEGGSHFEKPSTMTRENFAAFVWGEPGGRVNLAVNRALANAFPGAILSNYVLAGPKGGQPWFEGPLNDSNPMNESWKQLNQEN